MKQTLSFFIIVLSLLSCKSHKDVSRSLVTETKGESFVTVSDTSVAHRETLHKADAEKQEDRLAYSKQTNFGDDNNVVSTTERVIIYTSNWKFNSQLDEIKREDLKYSAATLTIDTTSTVVQEKEKETADSRLIQGWEWLYVVVGAIIILGLIAIYIKKRVIV